MLIIFTIYLYSSSIIVIPTTGVKIFTKFCVLGIRNKKDTKKSKFALLWPII